MLILSTYRVVLHPSYLQKVFSFIIFIKERYSFTILSKNSQAPGGAPWAELMIDEHSRVDCQQNTDIWCCFTYHQQLCEPGEPDLNQVGFIGFCQLKTYSATLSLFISHRATGHRTVCCVFSLMCPWPSFPVCLIMSFDSGVCHLSSSFALLFKL